MNVQCSNFQIYTHHPKFAAQLTEKFPIFYCLPFRLHCIHPFIKIKLYWLNLEKKFIEVNMDGKDNMIANYTREKSGAR
jgi:hypothetical protein